VGKQVEVECEKDSDIAVVKEGQKELDSVIVMLQGQPLTRCGKVEVFGGVDR